MKKPVILVLAFLYIIAIAVVGFFGVNPVVLNEKVYVNDITITVPDQLKPGKNSDPDVDYLYVVNDTENLSFNFTVQVTPSNATNKDCEIIKLGKEEDNSFYNVTTDFTGELTIAKVQCIGYNSFNTISLKIQSTDGNVHMYKIMNIYLRLA